MKEENEFSEDKILRNILKSTCCDIDFIECGVPTMLSDQKRVLFMEKLLERCKNGNSEV
jgi:hypothetical protein